MQNSFHIAETFWMHGGQPSGTYVLNYDGFGRLRDGWHYLYGNPTNAWSERDITYDRNGNVLSLLRYGSSGTTPTNNYTISYEGNRALLINGTSWYEYDFSGNVTGDAAREYAIGYNVLNLPSWFNDGQSDLCVFYDYLADGTKVALHREETGLGLAWLGDIVFNLVEPTQGIEDQQSRSTRQSKVISTANGYMKTLKGANLRNEGPDDPGNGEEEGAYYSFESTPYSGGRIEANGTGLTVRKFVTDHLGSIRAIVSNNTVVERSDYYPFGGRHDNTTLPTLTSNRYGFSGKERQNLFSTTNPYLDFGARFYDPLTTRWLSPDPLADKYTSLTQYNYCGNDPVNRIDPDGLKIWEFVNGKFVFKGDSDQDIVQYKPSSIEGISENKSISFPLGTIDGNHSFKYEGYPITALEVKGDIEAEVLLEFLATNVNNIEWEQVSVGESNTNYVGTSNLSDKTALLSFLFSNNYTIRSAVHSHPSDISDFSGNDKALFNAILKNNKKTVMLYIWTITHSYRQYIPQE